MIKSKIKKWFTLILEAARYPTDRKALIKRPGLSFSQKISLRKPTFSKNTPKDHSNNRDYGYKQIRQCAYSSNLYAKETDIKECHSFKYLDYDP